MKKIQIICLISLILCPVVMSSGCAINREEGPLYELADNYASSLVTKASDKINETKNNQNSQSTDQNTATPTQSSQTSQTTQSSQSSSQSSSTSVQESCSHPSIRTVYVGLDKSTGKIIYDTYCSKCGEYMGRVLYQLRSNLMLFKGIKP